MCVKLHAVCRITHCEWNYTMCVKWHIVCEIRHCVKRYTVRSPFCINCEKIPLSQFFYTSAAIDAIDKYQVCILISIYLHLYICVFVCLCVCGHWESWGNFLFFVVAQFQLSHKETWQCYHHHNQHHNQLITIMLMMMQMMILNHRL